MGEDTILAGPGRILMDSLKKYCNSEQNIRMARWFQGLKAGCAF